jgi:hypothetical protein
MRQRDREGEEERHRDRQGMGGREGGREERPEREREGEGRGEGKGEGRGGEGGGERGRGRERENEQAAALDEKLPNTSDQLPLELPFLKATQLSRPVPPAGDQVFRYTSLWGTFYIQSATDPALAEPLLTSTDNTDPMSRPWQCLLIVLCVLCSHPGNGCQLLWEGQGRGEDDVDTGQCHRGVLFFV